MAEVRGPHGANVMEENGAKGIIKGLQEAVEYTDGKINARRNKLSVTPLPIFKAEEIRTIRRSLDMTQAVFASFMGVSPKTVEAWERGRNTPDGPARRVLSMIQADPNLPERFNIIRR